MIQHTSSYEDDQGRKDKANDEQSSQRTIHNPTKDHMDLTKGVEHKPAHQLFFLLVVEFEWSKEILHKLCELLVRLMSS